MNGAEVPRRVDVCLKCGYSLRGLPASHHCPECGLPFDERSFVWTLRHRKRIGAGLAATLFYLYAVSLFLNLGSLLLRSAGDAFRMIPVIGFGLLMVYLARKYILIWWRGYLAATMPTGLYLRVDSANLEFIPWTSISRAAIKPSAFGAVIFLKHEKLVRDIVGPFRNREEAAAFVEVVSERIASYHAAHSPGAPTP